MFLDQRGGRLSTRGAYDQLKTIAADANPAFGRDGDLAPARRYSLPADADRQAVIERLAVDE